MHLLKDKEKFMISEHTLFKMM